MNKALYFLLGAVVGAAGSYFYFKAKYNEAEKELYSERFEERKEKKEDDGERIIELGKAVIEEKPDIMTLAKKIAENRYAKKEEVEGSVEDGPYLINPDEFGVDHDRESIIFYSDDVLAYEINDEIVENADELVGSEFKDHFGDYEEDMVYVRNDSEMTDFEIFKDTRTYEEVSGNKPHGSEDE